jgi:Domain of unknown function (DUF4259)
MPPKETGNFGNDDASDWVYELEESDGPDVLKEAFKTLTGNGYPDTPACCIALAAAEVVAAAKGKPPVDLPDDLRKWLENQENPNAIAALSKAAITAVNKISAKSELRDEWEESDFWREWQQVVEDLRRRLQG